MSSVQERLDEVIAEAVAPNAHEVDAQGRFPEASIAALRAAGAFGLISAASVGGEGLGVSAAVRVVTSLSESCASTAMVLCMHYAGAAVIDRFGTEGLRRDVATGRASRSCSRWCSRSSRR